MSNIRIFIVSYALDAEWLTYCLRSIDKYAIGFSGVTVAYPDRDDAIMRPICENNKAKAIPLPEPPPPLGHLYQNLVKTKADLYCPGEEYIMHLDSDCVITDVITPAVYFRNEKPMLVRRLWQDSGDSHIWRETVEKAVGVTVEYETMARMPLVYNVKTYADARNQVEQVHGQSFDAYVLKQQNTFPYGYCEFNTLGACAIEKSPELYTMVTLPGEHMPTPNPIAQLWSHNEFTPVIREWLELNLKLDIFERPPPPPAMDFNSMSAERRKMVYGV